MPTPPTTLTPMERQLLQRLQEYHASQENRLTQLDQRISALESGIRDRDRAIATLSDMLQRLLGPPPEDGSSRP